MKTKLRYTLIAFLAPSILAACGGSEGGNEANGIDVMTANASSLVGEPLQINSSSSSAALSSTASTKPIATTRVRATDNPPGDVVAPTAPTNLSLRFSTNTSIIFDWTPATDNVGVTQYSVYRNGVFLTVTTKPLLEDIGLSPNTDYIYSVIAKDAAGNSSVGSHRLAAKTLAADDGLDHLLWSMPTMRENGEALLSHEIAGYEIRFSEPGFEGVTSVILSNPSSLSYSAPEGTLLNPEIAVFDSNGLYSKFKPIQLR